MTVAVRGAAVVAGVVLLNSCLSDSDLPGQRDGSRPATELIVTPARVRLSVGQLVTFRAASVTARGVRAPVAASWTTSAPEVATVTPDGLVTGASPGRTELTARSGALTATAVIDVVEPLADTVAVLVGAGDIGACETHDPEMTARILDTIPGTIFTAGDNAYPHGSVSDFAKCYDLTWGRHKHRTRPSPGNHDYRSRGAAPYFAYFGANAGDPSRGYYSYDLGPWQIIALNSEVSMRAGSAQERWLRAELAAHPARCTLAYMHRPRFSSGDDHGSQPKTEPLFQALYDAGAEVLIGGHEHTYERFAPQTPQGELDRARGVRQFVVGTGGRKRDGFRPPLPHSEVRYNETKGVILLTLFPDRYSWEFVPVSGTFRDRGSDTCR